MEASWSNGHGVGHWLETAEPHFYIEIPITLFLSRMGDANHHAIAPHPLLAAWNQLIASNIFRKFTSLVLTRHLEP
jgi:hypothetical protein